MTTTVGVRELKDGLSRYVRLARDGERVIVLDRGKPVAILGPVGAQDAAPSTAAEHLAALAARGVVRLPAPGAQLPRRRPRGPRVDLSGAVDEDRGPQP